MELFRQEALQARRDDGLGSIDLTRDRLSWWLPGLLVGLLLTFACFLVFGQHQRRVAASGLLVPSLGLLDVTAPDAGVIDTLSAVPGQRVSQGQVLATLFVDIYTNDPSRSGVPVGSKVESVLAQQIAQAQGEREAVQTAASLRRQALEQDIELDRRQLEALSALRQAQDAELKEARRFQERVESTGRGALSEVQLRAYRAEVAVLERALAETGLRATELEQRLGRTGAELDALPLDSARTLTQIEARLAELQLSSARNGAARRIELRASRNGVVAETLAGVGQPVERGQLLLQLLPEDSELEAEFWLPSEAIGMIEADAPVQLRLRPFPFRSFGLQSGRVKSIAAVALTDAQAGVLGTQSRPPRYRVRVALLAQTVQAPDGGARLLRAGMQVDADVLLESRPLYQALWPQLAPPIASQGRS